MIDETWLTTQAEALIKTVGARESMYVLAIAGYPGSGKSTLSTALVSKLNEQGVVAALLGMDAFHYSNKKLSQMGIRHEKGMPHTFDHKAFYRCLEKIITQPELDHLVPVYSREHHEPILDASVVKAGTQLLVVEGNYLLLDQPEWRGLQKFWSQRWWIQVSRELAMKRLLQRHLQGGKSESAAQEHIQRVDFKNMQGLDESRFPEDQLLILPGND